MKILCLTNKNIDELHFIATPEGYVNYTVAQSLERYTYVYRYKDHLAVKDDTKVRARKYFNYITQRKTVLNPNVVQKHVNKEIERKYKLGQYGKPKKR